LNSLKDPREEILIEGFYDSLLSIEDEALSSLYTLPDVAPVMARQWGLKELLLGLQGLQMRYAHLLTPTCTINLLSGGDTTDPTTFSEFPPPLPIPYIPSQARAQIDFHLVPGQEPDAIFANLQRHLHSQGFSDIQTHLLYRCPPAYTSPRDAFAQLAYKATTNAYEHEPLLLPIQPESHPLALLQHLTGMPILITLSGVARQNRDHQTISSHLIHALKQIALIIHALSTA
jgi:acetylornithine deacetylase/succinyl-diaminopimelate desuccinylase-like protein